MNQSLCEACRRMREVITPKGSRFLLCQLSLTSPDYPKYPPQPIVRCEGFQPSEIAADRDMQSVSKNHCSPKSKSNADEPLSSPMTPLYEDRWFTFRFTDDRIIPRFHLEGAPRGQRISVFKVDPQTGERLDLLAVVSVGTGGWVDLVEPIIVRPGDAFIAVPEEAGLTTDSGR